MLIRQKPHHLILIQVSVTRVTFIFIIVNIKCTGVTAARCICHNLPLLKTYKKLQTSMFHSYFNEYAFDDINIYLLTSFVLSIGVNFGLTYPYIFVLTFQCQLANFSP